MDTNFQTPENQEIIEEIKEDEKKIKIAFTVTSVVIICLIAILIFGFLFLTQRNFLNKSSAIIPTQSPQATVDQQQAESPTSPISPTLAQSSANSNSSAKEYFVTLGTGTNSSSDWTDVPGAQANIDFGSYQNIKAIYFEASINVPTANETASIRLYNETDNHPVWYSDLTSNGQASSYLVSPAITYDLGAKTYQVQMKTQLQYPANLTQARIHIVLK